MQHSRFSRFAEDEAGATAIEYALIAGIVSIAIVAGLTGVRSALQTAFTSVVTGFEAANQ